jgi:hypothetical protein
MECTTIRVTKNGVSHLKTEPRFYIHRDPNLVTNAKGQTRYTIHIGSRKVVVPIKATTSRLGVEIKIGMVLAAVWERLEFEDPELFLYGGLVGWNNGKVWEYSQIRKNVMKTCAKYGGYPEMYRADGRMICEHCGKTYLRHPMGGPDGSDGKFLNLLCDGRLVKL